MPWSGGVFTRDYPSWTTDANNSLPISASKFDQEDNGFATGLNNCLTIDGLNKPTATLNWSVQMNWTRGTDGNIWSLARTGGSNNPKLQASVADATGITLALTGGALAVTSTGAASVAATGTLALSGTNFNLATGGDITARGAAICKWKAASTGRTLSTQLADPDLSYAVPGAGTYAIRMWLPLSGGAGGIQMSPQFTGTSTTFLFSLFGVLSAVTVNQPVRTPPTTGGDTGTLSAGDWLAVEGSLVATNSGTLALFWGQFVNNASATSILAGAYMTVTQLS